MVAKQAELVYQLQINGGKLEAKHLNVGFSSVTDVNIPVCT